MLSASDTGLGNLIQEDIQAIMSKMLDVTLWLSLSLRQICWQERHMQMAFCARAFRNNYTENPNM